MGHLKDVDDASTLRFASTRANRTVLSIRRGHLAAIQRAAREAFESVGRDLKIPGVAGPSSRVAPAPRFRFAPSTPRRVTARPSTARLAERPERCRAAGFTRVQSPHDPRVGRPTRGRSRPASRNPPQFVPASEARRRRVHSTLRGCSGQLGRNAWGRARARSAGGHRRWYQQRAVDPVPAFEGMRLSSSTRSHTLMCQPRSSAGTGREQERLYARDVGEPVGPWPGSFYTVALTARAPWGPRRTWDSGAARDIRCSAPSTSR